MVFTLDYLVQAVVFKLFKPDLVDHDFRNFFISKIESVPYININKLPLDSLFNQFLKRSFDIIFSFLVVFKDSDLPKPTF